MPFQGGTSSGWGGCLPTRSFLPYGPRSMPSSCHPRYHSFFLLSAGEFWGEIDPAVTDPGWPSSGPENSSIRSAVTCAIARSMESRGTSWGARGHAPLARLQLDHYDARTNYIKTDLGGYGLYCRSVIIKLELVYPSGPGLTYGIEVPTEKGKHLAATFRRAIEQTEYYNIYFDKDLTQALISVVCGLV